MRLMKILLLVCALFQWMSVSIFADEVSMKVGEGMLKGELNLIEGSGSRVVLFISGSGPTDKDGNTVGVPGKHNCLKYLSEFINDKGISTLRVDKRGIASSAGVAQKESEVRFSDFVDDMTQWIQFLSAKGVDEVILIGHSEGALVAILAAKHKNVKGVVSLAGAGEPAFEVLRKQLKGRLPPALFLESDQIMNELIAGRLVEKCSATLAPLFRPSVQPYLISSFQLDPAQEISKLNIPILVIQGSTDIQTSVEGAEILHEHAVNSKLKIIEGMNHVLKKIEGDLNAQYLSYFDPKLPIHDDLGAEVIKFIEGLK